MLAAGSKQQRNCRSNDPRKPATAQCYGQLLGALTGANLGRAGPQMGLCVWSRDKDWPRIALRDWPVRAIFPAGEWPPLHSAIPENPTQLALAPCNPIQDSIRRRASRTLSPASDATYHGKPPNHPHSSTGSPLIRRHCADSSKNLGLPS